MLLISICIMARASCITQFCPDMETLKLPKERHWDKDGLPKYLIFSMVNWKSRKKGPAWGKGSFHRLSTKGDGLKGDWFKGNELPEAVLTGKAAPSRKGGSASSTSSTAAVEKEGGRKRASSTSSELSSTSSLSSASTASSES